jgi:hypothetical protein
MGTEPFDSSAMALLGHGAAPTARSNKAAQIQPEARERQEPKIHPPKRKQLIATVAACAARERFYLHVPTSASTGGKLDKENNSKSWARLVPMETAGQPDEGGCGDSATSHTQCAFPVGSNGFVNNYYLVPFSVQSCLPVCHPRLRPQ